MRNNDPGSASGDWTIAEFVTVRSYVLRDGVQYPKDTLTVVVTAFGKRSRRTRVRLDRIHTDGKLRRSGWSLVTP